MEQLFYSPTLHMPHSRKHNCLTQEQTIGRLNVLDNLCGREYIFHFRCNPCLHVPYPRITPRYFFLEFTQSEIHCVNLSPITCCLVLYKIILLHKSSAENIQFFLLKMATSAMQFKHLLQQSDWNNVQRYVIKIECR